MRARFDHRNHDAGGAKIERPRQPRVFATRNPHHGLDRQAAAGGEQPLERLETQARVLHVIQHEAAAGVGENCAHAGREEFEHHRASNRLAAKQLCLDRIGFHG